MKNKDKEKPKQHGKFKPIGEDTPYFISSEGVVLSQGFKVKSKGGFRNTGYRIMVPNLRCGYKSLRLKINNKYSWYTIHRLVAKAFIPNPENKPQVNHINGIKTDNHVSNLQWVTISENTQHAYDTGLLVAKGNRKGFCGVLCANSKPVIQLSMSDEEIDAFESISLTRTKGFIPSCVNRCCNGKLKKHKGYLWKYKNAA